jgi:transcriptional regulator CtsR
MMGLSDIIESFIREAVESAGTVELQRGELAGRFRCVPSQINYVLTTRFTPERGYRVESRRGGGGYIRVIRVGMTGPALLMHAVNSVGRRLDARSAAAILVNLVESGAISPETARVAAAALSDASLRPAPYECRDEVRAAMLKQCLLVVRG